MTFRRVTPETDAPGRRSGTDGRPVMAVAQSGGHAAGCLGQALRTYLRVSTTCSVVVHQPWAAASTSLSAWTVLSSWSVT